MPQISVILPIYNAGKFLPAAIESILNQTFHDFEFIIIDDGSSDGSADVMQQYEDPRLIKRVNPHNMGLNETLNRGISIASAPYIARMDHDDISHQNRLAVQHAYMEAHPEIGLLASYVRPIDMNDQTIDHMNHDDRSLSRNAIIRWRLLWKNPVMHSTVMLRRSALGDLRYPPKNQVACEDYDLWTRLIRTTQIKILPDPLLDYRYVSTGMNRTMRPAQAQCVRHVIERELRHHLGDIASVSGLATLSALMTHTPPQTPDYAGAAHALTAIAGQRLNTSHTRHDRMVIYDDSLRYLAELVEQASIHQANALPHIASIRRRFELRYNPFGFIKRQFKRLGRNNR